MGKVLLIAGLVLSVVAAWGVYNVLKDGEPPVVPDFYWGPKEKGTHKQDTSIRPFKINVDDKILTDLKQRLTIESSADGNRLTPPLEGIGFQYGFNTNFLKTVINHWLTKYDWRAREKMLNKYPHFKTDINGLDIHFQHVKPTANKKYKETKPLLLLHGWPGSIIEFQKVIPLLVEPANSEINFELIIPSLPGYGFSDAAVRPGLGMVETAPIFLKLMKRLGHETFYVQGGDWGAMIGSHMAALYPKNVLGYHSNMCVSNHPVSTIRLLIGSICPSCFLEESDAQKVYPLSKFFSTMLEETGYLHLQATKPDTVGAGLSNSPTGLAAYIMEKFSTWTNEAWKTKTDGGLVPYYKLDDLLDNVMIYWVTNSITTSVRFYAEGLSKKTFAYEMDKVPVKVPTGCFSLRNEFLGQSEFQIRDKFPNLVSFTRHPTGGHFASFELPEPFAVDVIKFFNIVYNNDKSGKAKTQ